MSVPMPFESANSEKSAGNDDLREPIPQLLPHQKMYKIQIGSELFKVSGASLSSDGPSYFTEYFCKNSDKSDDVLFIDRSADIFSRIYQHLQGYAIPIKDEIEYTMIFSDAMYYHLPRLISILSETEYFYTNVGGQTFKFPKKLFCRKGDSPNYFHMTTGVHNLDLTKFVELSLKQLRPPPMSPPYIARSPHYFSDLLSLLSGASFEMDDEKRKSLIKECRYYMFLNLEQRLIKAKVIFNPLTQLEDILLDMVDLNKRYVVTPDVPVEDTPDSDYMNDPSSIKLDKDGSLSSDESPCFEPPSKKKKLDSSSDCYKKKVSGCWNMISYQRPYIDDNQRDLMFQINTTDSSIVINLDKKLIHLTLTGESASEFDKIFGAALLKVGINLNNHKFKLPVGTSKESVQLVLPACLSLCNLYVNSVEYPCVSSLLTESNNGNYPNCVTAKVERIIDFTNLNQLSCSKGIKLNCTRSIWKIGVRYGKVMLIAIKADTYHGAKEYCKSVNYL
ncbi:hypothetical protein Kpol_1033p27 [Vanderwaltozyma polyspora DSM 70294]|uniref:BTB domain-containing protein n=1 Tax=Vanderwaltozyma polyspora (strain ATCC 22028 / DSM 70294 / BCRC 21397 / CBS 2163 / NBRC 10782 / NRRL Y-8283 / UCD 57-17) TaxID=436907 RepID=A7TJ23_VANPO|nr:uncharacterized protein Kpol_1033p27 [Vanderwaltozyma polyspora DSM 70294]EDO17722.1 hypothetical protein Kpol_1033p27 [Vanderwaltozyma polyspora DSM 70294]